MSQTGQVFDGTNMQWNGETWQVSYTCPVHGAVCAPRMHDCGKSAETLALQTIEER